jgi:hypothetical protein
MIAFFFILGNISMMKSDPNQITTKHPIGSLNPELPHQSVVDDLNKYGQKLVASADHDCKSAKDQIMKMVSFKRQKEQDQGLGLSSFKLSLVEEDQQPAPTLENFEDYAPVDVPTPAQTPTRSISLQLRNCNDGQPKSANEYQTLHQSQFSSELRVPSMEKKGKDDLSYFYDTPASFDTLPKQAVQCPSEWEETTKREGEASVRI